MSHAPQGAQRWLKLARHSPMLERARMLPKAHAAKALACCQRRRAPFVAEPNIITITTIVIINAPATAAAVAVSAVGAPTGAISTCSNQREHAEGYP